MQEALVRPGLLVQRALAMVVVAALAVQAVLERLVLPVLLEKLALLAVLVLPEKRALLGQRAESSDMR